MISKNNKDVVDLEETIVSSANKKTETVIPVNFILIIVYFETNPLLFFIYICIFNAYGNVSEYKCRLVMWKHVAPHYFSLTNFTQSSCIMRHYLKRIKFLYNMKIHCMLYFTVQ